MFKNRIRDSYQQATNNDISYVSHVILFPFFLSHIHIFIDIDIMFGSFSPLHVWWKQRQHLLYYIKLLLLCSFGLVGSGLVWSGLVRLGCNMTPIKCYMKRALSIWHLITLIHYTSIQCTSPRLYSYHNIHIHIYLFSVVWFVDDNNNCDDDDWK